MQIFNTMMAQLVETCLVERSAFLGMANTMGASDERIHSISSNSI